ncbi:hypothetical protein G6F59_014559 [Rhizopus arrhizus]|nr:hypothetical protein G6F59_014559 [Rhizopus arrhizus]
MPPASAGNKAASSQAFRRVLGTWMPTQAAAPCQRGAHDNQHGVVAVRGIVGARKDDAHAAARERLGQGGNDQLDDGGQRQAHDAEIHAAQAQRRRQQQRDRQAHAAGGRMEQDGFAALQAIGLAEQVLHRQALEHQRSGFVETDALGHLDDLVGRHVARFGVGTDGALAVGDAVTLLQMLDVCAHGGRRRAVRS